MEGAYQFCGTRGEVGFQHGQALAGPVRRELEEALARCGGASARDADALLAHAGQHAAWARRHLPGFLEEVEGLARGAGIAPGAAFFLAVSDGLRPGPKGECTSFYCGPQASATGDVYLGQTKDTPPRDGRYFIMRLAYEAGPEMWLLNYAGWLANIGVTSYGLGLCGNALYPRKPVAEGRPFSLLKRAILESRSVDEARQFAEEGGWQDGCLWIAGAEGKAVVVELLEGRAHCREITTGAAGHANSILTPGLSRLDASPTESPCSQARQRAVDRALEDASGSVDEALLRGLLSDHSRGPICRHATEGVRTTAAFLANLTTGWVEFAIGYPCTAPFHRFEMK